MTVAEIIKSSRLENQMTQEEFGDKFGVTRQTVSSWENSKSIPDLEMLIRICNEYHISLDALLNEDADYVRKVDVLKKIKSYMKPIGISVSCALVICLALVFVRLQFMERANDGFRERVLEAGFVKEEGMYVKDEGGIIFELPNQKMPFWKGHFYASVMNAEYKNEDVECFFLLNKENEKYWFDIQYGLNQEISGSITENGEVIYDDLTTNGEEKMGLCQGEMDEILRKMQDYYKIAYQNS